MSTLKDYKEFFRRLELYRRLRTPSGASALLALRTVTDMEWNALEMYMLDALRDAGEVRGRLMIYTADSEKAKAMVDAANAFSDQLLLWLADKVSSYVAAETSEDDDSGSAKGEGEG